MDRLIRFLFLAAAVYIITVFATAALMAMFNAIGCWVVSPFVIVAIFICWMLSK